MRFIEIKDAFFEKIVAAVQLGSANGTADVLLIILVVQHRSRAGMIVDELVAVMHMVFYGGRSMIIDEIDILDFSMIFLRNFIIKTKIYIVKRKLKK